MKETAKSILGLAFWLTMLAITIAFFCALAKSGKVYNKAFHDVELAIYELSWSGENYAQEVKKGLDILDPVKASMTMKVIPSVEKEKFKDYLGLPGGITERNIPKRRATRSYDIERCVMSFKNVEYRFYMKILPYMTEESLKTYEFQYRLNNIYEQEELFDNRINVYNEKAKAFNELIKTNFYYRTEIFFGYFTPIDVGEYPILDEFNAVKFRKEIDDYKKIIKF